MNRPADSADLLSCPGLPLGPADEPVFAEPWQAQAFAMTLALHQRGLFSWPEWAATLSDQIRRAQAAGDADDGQHYYRHWLAALESIVLAKGLGALADLQRTGQAWAQAAERTPHGQAIVLRAGDYPPA